MKERIVELEKIIAFQSNEIQDLNEAITVHQRRIDRLEGELKTFIEKINSDALVKPIEDEVPPPHY